MTDAGSVDHTQQPTEDTSTHLAPPDPRATLAEWANEHDEWLRLVVRHVLASGRPLPEAEIDAAYTLFRQEKALDPRELPSEPRIELEASANETELPLTITKVSGVAGVNALVAGSIIEPHEGLTILFGENGTGKTGYSRIFKALADSRTADVILGDIGAEAEQPQCAEVAFRLGEEAKVLTWAGERGLAPFTRMSIFDSPSVNFHVDDDLEYVYVPTVLALFNHVVSGVRAIQSRIDSAVSELSNVALTLLSRFPRESSVYPMIETLGATTDLDDLSRRADSDPKVNERLSVLERAVAALEANTTGTMIKLRQRDQAVLTQAVAVADCLASFDLVGHNETLAKREGLRSDYTAFRTELFKAADLPAEPEHTWGAFVGKGEEYRQHLEVLGVHDTERCLYCRQTLSDPAKHLVTKYSEYLADKINTDITATDIRLDELTTTIRSLHDSEVTSALKEYEKRDDKPSFQPSLQRLNVLLGATRKAIDDESALPGGSLDEASTLKASLTAALVAATEELLELREQDTNRAEALSTKKRELTELKAAAELSRSWTQIQSQVVNAKESDKMKILARALPKASRSVTELAKTASDQLINQNFDKLFIEECDALRAPSLKLEFVGRQGKAQRRKVMKGKYKPSKVLSEGEQKVLALADFLAEARLAGITAPVIFDDPVSSLDHRRINEVAKRIAGLAEDNQVIVFTHDIFFATTLLSLFELSKRCTYFQITDDEGAGQVTRASGPRWDTLTSLRKNVNETILAAKAVDGEARAALVREGYDWIRSWCEVFTETELLQGVSQRYQPNIRMTVLPNIKTGALPDAITTVTRVFEEACRYIAGHSQPLATLGVSPTVPGLEGHWQELQDCRKAYLAAD